MSVESPGSSSRGILRFSSRSCRSVDAVASGVPHLPEHVATPDATRFEEAAAVLWECVRCGAEMTWAQYEASPSTSANEVFCSVECRDGEPCVDDDCEVCAFVASPLSPALAELAEVMSEYLDAQANIGQEMADREADEMAERW